MRLEEKLENEFKAALKEKNAIKVSTLRMLKADINNLKLDKNIKDLSGEEIVRIIKRHVKQHKESIEQFEKGKREDLVEKETKELNILKGYLPEEMPEEELKKIIKDTVSELKASGKKDMGKVMKAVMQKVKGSADGKKVSEMVSGMLT